MNKVLVFTNALKWDDLEPMFHVDDTLWNAKYYTIDENLVLKYGINNGVAILETLPELSIDKEGVYFVYDQIDEARLKQILDQCVNDEVFVLLHSSGVQKSSLNQDFIVLRGNHDTDTDPDIVKTSYYYPLLKLLTKIEVGDTVTTKMNRIIDSVFLDEVKSRFVKEFSTPNKIIGQSVTYRILHQIDRFKKPMEDFRKNYETSKTREEYVEDLIRLQEVLLSGKH